MGKAFTSGVKLKGKPKTLVIKMNNILMQYSKNFKLVKNFVMNKISKFLILRQTGSVFILKTGPVVKNPSCNAGDAGSIPGQATKIPHAEGQLSPRATTTELVRLN